MVSYFMNGYIGGQSTELLKMEDSSKDGDILTADTKGTSETITFDVGGTRIKTYRKTLQGRTACHLSDDSFLCEHYNTDTQEYFFDRDPDIFKAVLNYMRTGELHLPSYVCGPAAKTELHFWGISSKAISKCCWINYNEWNSTQDALKRLERDRKLNADETDSISASGWKKWRPYLWRILNRSNSSTEAKIFGWTSFCFVVLSISTFVAETTAPFQHVAEGSAEQTGEGSTTVVQISSTSQPNQTISEMPLGITESDDINKQLSKHVVLFVIDNICLVYFIIEYLLRVVFSPKKLKYVTSLLAIIDLLVIAADLFEITIYYLKSNTTGTIQALAYITILRLIRILRIFRLVRHSSGLWILLYTLRASVSELMLLVWFMGMGILVFSSLIYFVEDRDNFQSIPDGFWWSLITMTTVGYGDVYPVTLLGKIVGSMCAMSGVLMIGFTVPALVNNFMLYYRHAQFAMQVDDLDKTCPGDILVRPTASNNNGHQSLVSNEKLDNVTHM